MLQLSLTLVKLRWDENQPQKLEVDENVSLKAKKKIYIDSILKEWDKPENVEDRSLNRSLLSVLLAGIDFTT